MFRAFAASCAALFAVPLSAQGVQPGFERAPLPYPGGTSLAATLTLSTGEFLVFDGNAVVQYSPDGLFPTVLGSFPGFVFPSFLALDGDENALYVGESSRGGIHRLFVGLSSAPDLIATLPLNYDGVVFEDELWVSAATCGFGCGNELWRVDLATNVPTRVAQLPGASGPLALDADGALFYATASDVFPPPPGASQVVRFARSVLEGPLPFDLSAGTSVASGFDGAARLARDAERGSLFLVENEFSSGVNRIRRVGTGPASSPVLYEGPPGRSLGNLTLRTSTQDARAFLPYQPAEGGELVHTSTDFGSVLERASLVPRRPQASVSGPGTLGPGVFTVHLTHGVPAGFARLHHAPRGAYQALEPIYTLGGLPLSFGLAPGQFRALPGLLVLDSSGAFAVDYLNPGGYEGQYALQLLVLTPTLAVAGTSSAAFL